MIRYESKPNALTDAPRTRARFLKAANANSGAQTSPHQAGNAPQGPPDALSLSLPPFSRQNAPFDSQAQLGRLHSVRRISGLSLDPVSKIRPRPGRHLRKAFQITILECASVYLGMCHFYGPPILECAMVVLGMCQCVSWNAPVNYLGMCQSNVRYP